MPYAFNQGANLRSLPPSCELRESKPDPNPTASQKGLNSKFLTLPGLVLVQASPYGGRGVDGTKDCKEGRAWEAGLSLGFRVLALRIRESQLSKGHLNRIWGLGMSGVRRAGPRL